MPRTRSADRAKGVALIVVAALIAVVALAVLAVAAMSMGSVAVFVPALFFACGGVVLAVSSARQGVRLLRAE